MMQSSLTTWLRKSQPVVGTGDLTKDDNKPIQPPHPATIRSESDSFPSTRADARSLPPNVSLHPPAQADIAALKRLNQTLLPLPYTEAFYREITSDAQIRDISLLAFWNDRPVTAALTARNTNNSGEEANSKGRLVGAIRCRILAPAQSPALRATTTASSPGTQAAPPMLYISTLAVLAPYRGHGIAFELLRAVEQRAAEKYGCRSVGAHVWEANEEGLKWYRRGKFVEVAREESYYRKLKPTGAVVVERAIDMT